MTFTKTLHRRTYGVSFIFRYVAFYIYRAFGIESPAYKKRNSLRFLFLYTL